MDRRMMSEHLSLAEVHVIEGEERIARQQKIIAHLEKGGHDTTAARELLRVLEETQRLHVAERDRIRAELAHAT